MEHYIDGAWHSPASGLYLTVNNPCTGELIGQIARGSAQDVNTALESAQAAFILWKKQPMAMRAKLQHKAAELMRMNLDKIALTLAQELGRPVAGCRHEILRSSELLDYYAEEGLRMKGEIPWNNEPAEKAFVIHHPVGVVVAIAPFNYPVNLLIFKLGAALMTGCTVVAKPAEETPLSTLMLAELFTEAGYPAGVFNVITGTGSEIGDALVSHPLTQKIAFTGGTGVGQHIGALAAASTKRVTLELGGHSPAIVCADADLEKAVEAIARHGFANSGQFCYRVNRVYVHKSIEAEFSSKLAAIVSAYKLGNALDKDTDLGPLINEKIFRNASGQVADAREKGATIITGGFRLTGGIYDTGFYYSPTLIQGTDHSMKIMTEETFGPVIGIMGFDLIDEALALANDSIYGLAAYIFSKDISLCLKMADELDAGSIWINNIHRSHHHMPFGGFKQSGIGREKSAYGLQSYTELKSIYLSY